MPDAQNALASPPATIRREDYRPPDWLVPEIDLEFELAPQRTLVRSTLHVERAAHSAEAILKLNGAGKPPRSVRSRASGEPEWRMDGNDLLIRVGTDTDLISIETEISPAANTQLMGLYESGGLLCTQCEAEGFRRITFFPDRPDVLSRYRVRMIADPARFPILLSNGDPVARGTFDDGRHWAEWHDPFPKPCYLFALVAGDLAANRDRFVTRSGRIVELGIWVRAEDLSRTAHAMSALKAAMAWDEKIYGREYDLAVFNIVAVADFNFGAMENKGLNIFNSRFILADPDTATDQDYDSIAGVVAHEYFHNWSGNRVTCRDWFQLSLKEGFTVFRDQQFSAGLGSAAVKRIEDVRMLRSAQFQEDAGPLAHPVRPESYMEIANFYTATVYNKGAELIRMLHTMLGADRFRAGSDLYFERHDGEAATCEDFVAAMEDATGVDLGRFRLWYEQAGTPRVRASLSHDEASGRARLLIEQEVPPTPGQPAKQPMPIPLKLALFGAWSGTKLAEQLVLLEEASREITIEQIGERPILSINRDFSAPVIVESGRSPADLALLSGRDDNPFARYEAMQQLMVDTLLTAIATGKRDHAPVIEAVRETLLNAELDPSFIAEVVLLPNEPFIGDQMLVVDPDAIHLAREALRSDLGRQLESLWRAAYSSNVANRYEYSPSAKGARRLRGVGLSYLMAAGAPDAPGMAMRQLDEADNMTDRQGALSALANSDAPERALALTAFYERHRDNPLVLDKWFTVQALSTRNDTPQTVARLADHADFTLANPNRLRALVGSFASNQRALHDASGAGYRFLADMILAVDALNPQAAARLVPPLGRWRRFDERRAALIKTELRRILGNPGLSRDVFEQTSKSLG